MSRRFLIKDSTPSYGPFTAGRSAIRWANTLTRFEKPPQMVADGTSRIARSRARTWRPGRIREAVSHRLVIPGGITRGLLQHRPKAEVGPFSLFGSLPAVTRSYPSLGTPRAQPSFKTIFK